MNHKKTLCDIKGRLAIHYNRSFTKRPGLPHAADPRENIERMALVQLLTHLKGIHSCNGGFSFPRNGQRWYINECIRLTVMARWSNPTPWLSLYMFLERLHKMTEITKGSHY